jgi:hypothetical protein
MSISDISGESSKIDDELLRAARLGNAQSWNLLVEALAPAVWNVAKGSLNLESAHQVSVLTWMRFADRLVDLDSESVRGWLLATAQREVARANRLLPRFGDSDCAVDPRRGLGYPGETARSGGTNWD